MSVRHHHRINETTWEMRTFTDPEDVVRLESLDVTMTLADIYRKIKFPEPLIVLNHDYADE